MLLPFITMLDIFVGGATIGGSADVIYEANIDTLGGATVDGLAFTFADPERGLGGAVMNGSAFIFDVRPLLPRIQFEVDLMMPTSELFGPTLNLRKVPVYHSEGNSADATKLMVKQRESQFSGILMSLSTSGGRAVKHGDRFTVEGEKAIYLRDMYTTANPTGFPATQLALLKIVGADQHDHDVYKRGILTPGVQIQ